MKLLREYIRELLAEKNILATGMCFPFAYQKAEEWFEKYYTKGRPGRSAKRHPDLNNKSKFKVVHGTVTNKWKSPPKPIVHGWVEMGDLVFDDQTKVTKPNGVDKEAYYDMYQPEVYKEFTAEEAILNCVMKGGEGPWDDDLYAMMQDRDAWMKESNEYSWETANKRNMKLDKEGMEQSDKDNQEKFLQSIGLMESNLLLEQQAGSVVVVDVQPEYEGALTFDVGDLLRKASEYNKVLFLYNGADTLGMIDEAGLRNYYFEKLDYDEDAFDDLMSGATFFDKGYGFFRDVMDSDVCFDRVSIVRVVEHMIANNIQDIRDLDEDDIEKIGVDELLFDDLEDYGFWVPELSDILPRWGGSDIMGGARNECMAEVEILGSALGLSFTHVGPFVYEGDDRYKDEILIENVFRKYIRELLVEQVEFSGILKLMPDANVVASTLLLSEQLPPEAIMVPDDKLHVTLIHQGILKPYRKELKTMQFPPAPAAILEPAIEERVDDVQGKRSWVVWLQNQDEMKTYVQEVMQLLGAPPGDPEPERRFHISIANLTGKPGDSVR